MWLVLRWLGESWLSAPFRERGDVFFLSERRASKRRSERPLHPAHSRLEAELPC
jgi:hypothetical protein